MKTLLTSDQIHEEVSRLGKQISLEYENRPLTILGVLTGSIVFLADLIRNIDIPLRVGLIQASSYRGTSTKAGTLNISADLLPEIKGRDVILIDDIFDTGNTLHGIMELVQEKNPNSLKSAVLLWKEDRQEIDLTPDYHSFKIPNEFVVGYGLDYNDDYRHLPYIATLEEAEL